MKTKRIVALALAGVLAAGAIAPVYAAGYNGVEGAKSSEEYAMLLKVQTEKTAEADAKYAEALKSARATKAVLEAARDAVTDAQADYDQAEQAVKLVQTQIDDLVVKQEVNLDAQNKAEVDFAVTFDGAKPLANVEEYDRQLKALNDKAIANKKLLDDEKTSDAQKEVLKVAQDEISAQWSDLRDQKAEFLQTIDPLQKTDVELAEQIHLLQDKDLKAAEAALVMPKKVLEDAIAAEKIAADNFASALVEEDAALRVKNALDRDLKVVQELGAVLTKETIENETDPKLAELAKTDFLAYLLGKLAEDTEYLAQETIDALDLSAETKANLAAYTAVLADEDEIADPEGEEMPNTDEEQKDDGKEQVIADPEGETGDPVPGENAGSDTDPEVIDPSMTDDKKTEETKTEEKKDDVAPKTGDISVIAYAASAVAAAGAFVASKKRK